MTQLDQQQTFSPKKYDPIEAVGSWWKNYGKSPRVLGLDIARGVAILGMAAAHLGAQSEFVFNDPATWSALAHGRSSILFALLAGISIALITGGRQRPSVEALPRVRLSLVGRGAAIFIIGLALELLNTPVAIILTFYGLLYTAAIPALRWSPKRLLLTAGGLALAGPPLVHLLPNLFQAPMGSGLALVLFGTYSAPVWLALMLTGMALGQLRLSSKRLALRLSIIGICCMLIGYGASALPLAQKYLPSSLEDSGLYPQGPLGGSSGGSMGGSSSSSMGDEFSMPNYQPAENFDFNGFACDGDGEYISCMRSSEVPVFSAEDFADSYTSSGQGGLSYNAWTAPADYLEDTDLRAVLVTSIFSSAPHSGGTAEVIGSGGFALTVLGLCLLLTRVLRWLLLPVAALGSMPLSAYCAHILSFFILAGPGGYDVAQNAWGTTAVCLLLGCTAWAMFLGRGPLERLTGKGAKSFSEPVR